MTRKLYLILSILIISLGLFLRLYKLENRAPFDWDQNRDYQAISSISAGKFTLIGPVAKGEGGFFLGPLYYYLATPTYYLFGGSPLALPVTSIILDIFTLCAILLLLRKTLGDRSTLVLSALWSLSWFAIEMSRISWNVALVPLWSILVLWLLTKQEKLGLLQVGLLGLVAGLSWHIHAALIPLAVVIMIFSWRVWAPDYKKITLFILGYGIALSPLILFDLRHSGLNYHLLTQLVTTSSPSIASDIELLSSVMMRLGKNTAGLLLGSSGYNLILGYLVSLMALVALLKGRGIYRLSGLIITINLLAMMILQEIGFPEYYLAACYLPSLILLLGSVSYIFRTSPLMLVIVTLLLIIFNVSKYSSSEVSFSLSRKASVAQTIRALNSPVDLRFALSPGREGGILAFYQLSGGALDSTSPLKVIVTDQVALPSLLGGQDPEVIGKFGELRVVKIVVQ